MRIKIAKIFNSVKNQEAGWDGTLEDKILNAGGNKLLEFCKEEGEIN